MIILIIIAFALIALIEIRSLLKRKYIKELVVFCVLLSVGFVLCILLTVGVTLPNPVQGIIAVLDLLHLHF